jgi:two-component system sensor histidine kinase KdpD
MEEQLIRTLANHAAVVLARQDLVKTAAQAEALREADALKDRILSLASHELRTPLASIKAAASGLLQEGAEFDEEERRDALRSISSEIDRLANLVGNMLDLSRLEAGSWKPHKDWCDIREVISTALDRLDEDDATRIAVICDSDITLVRMDYTQIALVLTNLLNNAIKYGQQDGPVEVNCRVQTARSGDRRMLVAVRDHGEGIPPGEFKRIFDRFYRSPRHVASTVHGTGLGLSLCQAIVAAHEGRIWASGARDGSGAVLSFTLPMGTE